MGVFASSRERVVCMLYTCLNTVPEYPFEPGGARNRRGNNGSKVRVLEAVGRETILERVEMNRLVHVGRDDEGIEGVPSAVREGDADNTHLRKTDYQAQTI